MAGYPRHDHASEERETMSKHREILKDMEQFYQVSYLDNVKLVKSAKKRRSIGGAKACERCANEAQERADAIRYALDVMARAETLPKSKDNVTIWPNDWVWTWNKEDNGKITINREPALANWNHLYLCYSTEQAARDAAKDIK
jgi:hypothetical protein